MPMVVKSDGYLVMWPCLLTWAVSVARMRPFDPPLIHACEFVVLQGSVMWIVPDVNATHLFVFVFFPLLAGWVFLRERTWGGGREGAIYCTAGALCKPPSKFGGMDR